MFCNLLYYIIGPIIVYPMLRLMNRVRINHLDRLPMEGPVMLIANHLSLWDPIYLFCMIHRRLNFMGKSELFEIPALSWILRHVHVFPVKRNALDRQALKTAAETLERGEALVIFPEGTRSKDGRLLPLKDGAALFAYRSDCTVIPLAISNTQKTFPKGFRQRIIFNFGEPIDMAPYKTMGKRGEALTEITKEFTKRLEQLQKENSEVESIAG